jgi:hypothetical protein
MKYVAQVCIQIATRESDIEEFVISRSNHVFIRTVSGTASFISQLPSRPKQDFNQLFGFKYDAGTQTPISGVSPQGI